MSLLLILTGGAPPAPVAEFAMDGTGTNVPDKSGYGHDGTMTLSTSRVAGHGTTNAVRVAAGRTDGSRVNVPRHADLEPANTFTIMGWYRTQSNQTGWKVLAGKGRSAAADSYAIYASHGSFATNEPTFVLSTSTTVYEFRSSTTITADGTWHHIACVYDGATMRTVIDGTQVASQAATGAILYDSTDFAFLGSASFANESMDNADVDDVRFFPLALTNAEINTWMGTPVSEGSASVTATATLAGTGTLGVTSRQDIPSTVALVGVGSLGVTGSQQIPTSVTLAGVGTLQASGVTGTAATLAGVGTLSVAGRQNIPAAAALAGSGTLTVTGRLNVTTAITLAGAGTLAVTGRQTIPSTATLPGVGELLVSVSGSQSAAATLAGSGTLSVAGRVLVTATVTLAGVGTLAITGRSLIPSTVSLAGLGAILAAVSQRILASAVLQGSGTLIVGAIVQAPATGTPPTIARAVVSIATFESAVAPHHAARAEVEIPTTTALVRPESAAAARATIPVLEGV